MALGAKFRKLRLDNEWTLEMVSERCGVDVGTISAIEKRDSSRSKYATKIAKAFGLTVEQIEDDNYIDSTATRIQDAAEAIQHAEPELPLLLSSSEPPLQPQTLDEKIAEVAAMIAALPDHASKRKLAEMEFQISEHKIAHGGENPWPSQQTIPVKKAARSG
jgi:transcriptional regulator with XRE-family HTH domain